MADRRCLHKRVVESDAFYALSEAAQALYLHLNLAADDDGFINSANSVAAKIKGGKAALAALVNRAFLLRFGEIYVIKDWRVSNSLKNDRTKPPTYPDIAARIWIQKNRSYGDYPAEGCKTLLETKCGIQNGIQDGIHLESNLESQQNRTELNRTEGNRNEGKGMESTCAGGMAERFQEFWAAYPKHTYEADARVKWNALASYGEDLTDKMLSALPSWKKSDQWRKENGRYIPRASNWLSDSGNWECPPTAGRELDDAELEAIRRLMEDESI